MSLDQVDLATGTLYTLNVRSKLVMEAAGDILGVGGEDGVDDVVVVLGDEVVDIDFARLATSSNQYSVHNSARWSLLVLEDNGRDWETVSPVGMAVEEGRTVIVEIDMDK